MYLESETSCNNICFINKFYLNTHILSNFAVLRFRTHREKNLLILHRTDSLALPGDDIAVVVKGAASIAVTGLAAVGVVTEVEVLGQTLVAVAPSYETLAATLTGVNVATKVVDRTEPVAGAFWQVE